MIFTMADKENMERNVTGRVIEFDIYNETIIQIGLNSILSLANICNIME